MNIKPFLWLLILSIFMTGCGQKPAENSVAEAPTVTQAPAEAQPIDPASAGTIKGRVLFEGVVPPAQEISVQGNPECAALHAGGKIASEELIVSSGALQNVFVYVKEGLEGRTFPVPTEAVTIENKNCVYVPHVLGVQINQPLLVVNSDPTLHNVHALPKNSKGWNLGLPFQGIKQTKKFEAPEVMVHLKCDVHPWMSGFVGVLPHPYFSVTSSDGSFEIRNLPPGEYTIEAWHEKLGVRSQKIKIEPQQTKEIEFKYSG